MLALIYRLWEEILIKYTFKKLIVMKKISYLSILFLILGISAVFAKDKCLPEFKLSQPLESMESNETDNEKKSTFIYFDQSLSMQGYTVNQPGLKNLYVSVIDDLQQIAENVGDKTYYQSFGKNIKTIKENEIARVIKPSFYACTSSTADCNNQESKIHLPFKFAKTNPNGTYIIVTDLFLSSKQLVGTTKSQLTKPLKSILKNGKSVGIFGVMSSFNGTIYDIPTSSGGTVSYTEAQKRPFYIIIIGDQKDINKVKKNLIEQHFKDEDSNYKYTLITSTPILQNLNQNKLILEDNIKNISKADNFNFEYLDNSLPLYKFDTNNKRKFNFKIYKSKIIVEGSTGVAEYSIKEKLWTSTKSKCSKINWELAKIKNIAIPNIGEDDVSFKIFQKKSSLKNLFRGWRYFYLAEIYAEKPGSASEEVFQEWSVSDPDAAQFTDGNPVEFKTLNLVKIIRILNSVATNEFQPTLIASLALDFNLTK